MSDTTGKRALVIIRHSPYGSSLGRAALDTALAMAAFEQPVDILFMGDGVAQLLPEQDSNAIGVKNIGKLLGSLPLYGIDFAYADSSSLQRFGLDPAKAPVPLKVLDGPAINALMAASDHLLGM